MRLRPMVHMLSRVDEAKHTPPVTVKSNTDKEEITQKATAKQSSFDQTFDGTIPYVLLFPDFSEVNFVPRTKEPCLVVIQASTK